MLSVLSAPQNSRADFDFLRGILPTCAIVSRSIDSHVTGPGLADTFLFPEEKGKRSIKLEGLGRLFWARANSAT